MPASSPGEPPMTPPHSPARAGPAEAVRAKLQDAPAPLKLAEVVKGLPRPKKVKKAEWAAEVRQVLEEEVRLARAYSYPSGKNGELRHWSRDEKQLLRDKALALA